MTHLFEPIAFPGGAAAANRFMLAPLTHTMSSEDGTLSPEDFLWLVPRARGGFGLITTAAAHVQASGQGFPGQPGIFSDRHVAGLSRLAEAVRTEGSLLLVQLHHAGARSPADLIAGAPAGPSDNPEKGVRALGLAEVEQLTEDFITAAERAQRAGCDGVEVHGAHGYVISQFLSPAMNQRSDRYGGSLENRARLLFDVVDRPQKVVRAEQIVMDAWIRVFSRYHDLVREASDGGTTCWFDLWAPGRFYPTHNDFSYMISPDMYRRIFLPQLVRQTEFLDYTVYHVDGIGAFAHVPMLCEIPRLQAIQILPGAGKPSPLHYLETLRTGRVCYYSRSRSKLWRKGEESGNVQEVCEIFFDCDADTLLVKVRQIGGAACHEGYRSCFFRKIDPGSGAVSTTPAALPTRRCRTENSVQARQAAAAKGRKLTGRGWWCPLSPQSVTSMPSASSSFAACA